jgi:deazaflavin-dependent oxidoreductase (nitroreductase family)
MRRTLLIALGVVALGVAAVLVHDLVDLGRDAAPAAAGTARADRLARVADRPTVRLTHHGRRSGKAYEVTLWFAVDGDTIYLNTMDKNRQWVRNVTHTPRVQLRIGPEVFEGTVTPVTAEAEERREYELLRRKYWTMRVVDVVLRLAGRDPAVSVDSGAGGYFRVDP